MNDALAGLQQCIRQQCQILEQLLVVLESEHQALSHTAAPSTLNALSQQKSDCARELAALDDERTQILQALGITDPTTSFAALCQSDPDMHATFEQLGRLTEQARNKNSQNGEILRVLRQYNRQALQALHAQTGHMAFYDARGRLATNTHPFRP